MKSDSIHPTTLPHQQLHKVQHKTLSKTTNNEENVKKINAKLLEDGKFAKGKVAERELDQLYNSSNRQHHHSQHQQEQHHHHPHHHLSSAPTSHHSNDSYTDDAGDDDPRDFNYDDEDDDDDDEDDGRSSLKVDDNPSVYNCGDAGNGVVCGRKKLKEHKEDVLYSRNTNNDQGLREFITSSERFSETHHGGMKRPKRTDLALSLLNGYYDEPMFDQAIHADRTPVGGVISDDRPIDGGGISLSIHRRPSNDLKAPSDDEKRKKRKKMKKEEEKD